MQLHMLVVLDLNGTILDSTHKRYPGREHDAKARSKFVYFRPHMHAFLTWLFAQPEVEVGVWTSNIAENAQAIVQTAFTPQQQAALKFVLSRSSCEVLSDYSSRKHAKTLWDMGYTPENTLIVDDSPGKMLPLGMPYYLQVPEFAGNAPQHDLGLVNLQQSIEKRLPCQ